MRKLVKNIIAQCKHTILITTERSPIDFFSYKMNGFIRFFWFHPIPPRIWTESYYSRIKNPFITIVSVVSSHSFSSSRSFARPFGFIEYKILIQKSVKWAKHYA